jgi:hypothetical protein
MLDDTLPHLRGEQTLPSPTLDPLEAVNDAVKAPQKLQGRQSSC